MDGLGESHKPQQHILPGKSSIWVSKGMGDATRGARGAEGAVRCWGPSSEPPAAPRKCAGRPPGGAAPRGPDAAGGAAGKGEARARYPEGGGPSLLAPRLRAAGGGAGIGAAPTAAAQPAEQPEAPQRPPLHARAQARPLSCGPRGSSPCWAGGAGRGAPGSTLRPSQCRLGTWVSVGWRLLGFPFFTILLWEHQAHDHVLTGLTSCLLENLLTLIFSNVKMQTCAIVTCRIAFISLPFVSK